MPGSAADLLTTIQQGVVATNALVQIIAQATATDTVGNTALRVSGAFRELLTSDQTFYVRTDGSDSNMGTANTAAGAFLTIGRAMTAVGAIDTGSHQLAVSVGAGTFNEFVVLAAAVGSLAPILIGGGSATIVQGNGSTPGTCFLNSNAGSWIIRNFKVQQQGSLTTNGLVAQSTGIITFRGIEFGAVGAGLHIFSTASGTISCDGDYSITGGAQVHIISNQAAILYSGFVVTITLTGTPAFSLAFAVANRVGLLLCFSSYTFTGAATGQRYIAQLNGVIDTGGAGTTFFPGSIAGTTPTGGQYA